MEKSDLHKLSDVKVDIKQRLSAHVHNRMANLNDGNSNVVISTDEISNQDEKLHPKTMIKAECIKVEKDDIGADNEGESQGGPSSTASFPAHQQGPTTGGSFMAGSLILSNSILDEVLNEKKLALLQSPEVIRFLQEKQNKKL